MGNLLENAAEFDADSDEPTEVHIHRGLITVFDRGPGIRADDTERVFDRFHRAGTARGVPGSGLGLAIVRDIAEAHGSTVFAGSRPRRRGRDRVHHGPLPAPAGPGTGARHLA